jgi:hypothetical protein
MKFSRNRRASLPHLGAAEQCSMPHGVDISALGSIRDVLTFSLASGLGL